MNTDQKTRLEIMKALEKDFPDRLLEDLIDVALYVEVGGVERARLKESAEKFFETLRHLNPPTPAQDKTSPRKWTNLDAIPSNVKAITDSDGERAEPRTFLGKRKWVFTEVPFDGVTVSPDDGPFTEVCNG